MPVDTSLGNAAGTIVKAPVASAGTLATESSASNTGFTKPPIPRAATSSVLAQAGPPNVSGLHSPPDGSIGQDSRPASIERPLSLSSSVDPDSVLPPPDEVVEGCRIFVTSYFQLGFIPKAIFLESLNRDPNSASKFLLSCILSISARFTPPLVRRYGSADKATNYFLEVSKGMVAAEMYRPSLERIQAFFLLAISQWGNGDRDRSSMDMGVAVRMAGLLKLHCEESYILDDNSPADQVVRSESARRVFWMIQSQENLHSAYKSPAPFPLEDITTLLPCNEADFAFGVIPQERAAVAGTPPAIANPTLAISPRRCLFATLIQAHGLWGKVARRACRTDYSVSKMPPWDSGSEFQKAAAELQTWEDHLPPKHAFSIWNLRGWRSESLHLAYLAVTMVLRLSNIVTRRIYLDDMLATITTELVDQAQLEPSTPTMGDVNTQTRGVRPLPNKLSSYGPAPPGFWAQTSKEMFENVWNLHEQVDAYFNMRSPDEGFPQILVFCVYMCGSLASYLWRYPGLSPQLSDKAEMMAKRSLEVLTELHAAWPTSTRWQKGLQQIATPITGQSPADEAEGHQSLQNMAHTPGSYHSPATAMVHPGAAQFPGRQPQQQQPIFGQSMDAARNYAPEGILGDLINVLPNGNNYLARIGNMQMNAPMPNELFDAELNAFIHGGFHYDGWQT